MNWVTSVKDRSIKKTLHKYNLLTDIRMSVYELFYGKEYIIKNKEKLIQHGNSRIESIRNSAKSLENSTSASFGRKELKKKYKGDKAKNTFLIKKNPSFEKRNLKKNKIERRELGVSDSEDADESLKNQKGTQKKRDSSRAAKKKIKKDRKKNSSESLHKKVRKLREGKDGHKRKKTSFSFISLYKEFQLYLNYDFRETKVNALIETSITPKYFGLGLIFSLAPKDYSFAKINFNINNSLAVSKGDYTLPSTRNLDVSLSFDRLYSFIGFSTHLSISSLSFINLPVVGEGIQVYNFQSTWFLFGPRILFNIFSVDVFSRITLGKLLSVESDVGSISSSTTGSKVIVELGLKVFKKIKINIKMSKTKFIGRDSLSDITVKSDLLSGHLIYEI